MESKNNLFIISGPSGAGEDSIIEGLKKYFEIERVITTTSRQMRKKESPGSPYYFISRPDFETGIKENKFFEWAKQYNDNYYGVTHEEIKRVQESGKIGIWKIEYQGIKQAKKLIPKIKAILINAPLEQMRDRIKKRDQASDEFIETRMQYTKEWLKHKDIYDYEVNNPNGKLAEATREVKNIIEKNL